MTTKAQRSRGMPRRSIEAESPPRRLPLIIAAAIGAVLLAAALAAVLMSGTPATGLAEPAPQPVAIGGTALPALTDPTSDAAVGQPIPQLSGIGLDGAPLSIGPSDGPMAIVVLAHWCSFCQEEVPVLADYMAAGGVPDGVSVVALTTSIDPARPNFPPSSWFEREGWTVPTMIDDASNRGLAALGISSFPAFVFVDGDGRVAYRATGGLGAEAFDQIVRQLAP